MRFSDTEGRWRSYTTPDLLAMRAKISETVRRRRATRHDRSQLAMIERELRRRSELGEVFDSELTIESPDSPTIDIRSKPSTSRDRSR